MKRSRIKKTIFTASSSKLRARALVRIGLEHFVTDSFFNPQTVRVNYANC